MDGCTDKWMDGCTDKWMNVLINGWMYGSYHLYSSNEFKTPLIISKGSLSGLSYETNVVM